MKILKFISYWTLAIIFILVVTIGFFYLIEVTQQTFFVPKDYLMWIFRYPESRFVTIYEVYVIWGCLYIFRKLFRRRKKAKMGQPVKVHFRRHKNLYILLFVVVNVLLLYLIISSVTVITKNRIINYSFFSPQGKPYHYNDVVKINTGVYGRRLYLPFTHTKGDFFYKITLNDGSTIDLTEVGGSKGDVDPRFIIEKLDKQLVNMGINKVTSMKNFNYAKYNLGKVYTDQIHDILTNK